MAASTFEEIYGQVELGTGALQASEEDGPVFRAVGGQECISVGYGLVVGIEGAAPSLRLRRTATGGW